MPSSSERCGAPIGRLDLLVVVLLLLPVLGCTAVPERAGTRSESGRREFVTVLQELAAAWNEGDAERAALCFTEDAVYSEPPDKQRFEGRRELFEFFGGAQGRQGQMEMVWHHLAYSPETGVGFGEFSFTYGSTAHGVAVVKLLDGKISNWREYWYGSDLPWAEFIAANEF